MYGCSAGEVEAAYLVDPARGIPGPAGEGVIDDGGPDEHEDDAGEHAAAFGDGADCDSHSLSPSTPISTCTV